MSDGLIPQRYAKALYKYACEKGNTAEVYNEVKHVAEAFRANPDMQKAMSNPFIDKKDKERLMLSAAGSLAEDNYSRFVRLILNHHREDYAYLMMLAFCSLYREANKIKSVKITTAVNFAEPQMEKLRNVVEKAFKDSTLEYTYEVDPETIGGFIIDVDSVRMDASISGEIEQLRQNLLK